MENILNYKSRKHGQQKLPEFFDLFNSIVHVFIFRFSLEHVEFLMPRRKRENFIFSKTKFAVECGRFGENFNAEKNKICRLQPGDQKLNMLLGVIRRLYNFAQILHRFVCTDFTQNFPRKICAN